MDLTVVEELINYGVLGECWRSVSGVVIGLYVCKENLRWSVRGSFCFVYEKIF